ncbi:MAG TPA: PEP-CTERM sorting domain-containing protein [Aquabacterium sp.]|uniref:PEP-CTERM sorting domain-containing protein n=1 Tax=Aquabacterium sp. TaxID=1872578 RepID=UPI002E325C98|nr:PEP-CTERM sorting domain-containing protein [Aquabacterium sp.]HEX5354659.1 PEP-CTERM sorting domain-containing protein [Aquabacterium sp.]
MRLKSICVAMLGAFACASALADTVEVLVDVHVRSHLQGSGVYQVGNMWGPLTTTSTDVSDAFQITLSIDLDGIPSIPPNVDENFALVEGRYELKSMSASPYTASLMARLAAQPEETYSGGSVASTLLVANAENWTFGNAPTTFTFDAAHVVGGYTFGAQSSESNYARAFSLRTEELYGVPRSDFQVWRAAGLVDYLQSLVGTQVGDFNETYTRTVRNATQLDGAWVPSNAAQDVVAYDHESYVGAMTIRSVTVVPEPASSLMMGFGLFGLGCMVRRRGRR